MQPRFAIIAALPREIAALTGRVRAQPSIAEQNVCVYHLGSAVVAAAGMGAERVTLAVDAALRLAPGAMLVSAGLAGATTAAVAPGTVVEAGSVVDSLTGEHFTSVEEGPVLVSTPAIASIAEKSRLAQAYHAALVDMEAATVARLAAARGLLFRAVKGISDAHDFELASLGRFTGPRGTFRTGAFAIHTALHPTEWRKAMTLGRHSQAALSALTARLRSIIAE